MKKNEEKKKNRKRGGRKTNFVCRDFNQERIKKI